MKTGMHRGAALVAATLALSGSTVLGQVIERDTKVTGPRGRSIERKIESKRGPGYVERDVRIQRGNQTFERDTVIRGPRSIYGGGPGPFIGGGGGPRIIERNVFVQPEVFVPAPAPVVVGGGLPFFSFFFNSPPPPPPPVVVAEPPPQVVYQPPVRYAEPSAPQTVMVDPVAQAAERLKSYHANSRRDAALTLGRLGDARAVRPLVERLEKDFDKDVRVASAWALGEIGAPGAALALEKAQLYDRKQEVRDVATVAYKKLGRPRAAQPAPAANPEPMNLPSGEPPLDLTTPPPSQAVPPPPPMPDPLPDLPSTTPRD